MLDIILASKVEQKPLSQDGGFLMHKLSTVINQPDNYTYNKNTKLNINNRNNREYINSVKSVKPVSKDINCNRVNHLADRIMSECSVDARWRDYVLKAVWNLPESIIVGIIEMATQARNPERYAMSAIKRELAKRGI